MNDRTNRTVICSIAFLDIVDYSQRVGQEQVVLKQRFNSLIGEVIKDIAQNDRVLIDTGDGAALCFMGDPEDALFVVMNFRDHLRTPENEAIGLNVRIGINLGPVRLIHDINDRQNVIGDGINVAQRVMSFAEPNQIMVSRSYYEVVSRLSQEYTQLFNYAGARKDKHVREHEVYEVGPGNDDADGAAAESPPETAKGGATPAPALEATVTGTTASAATVAGPTANAATETAATANAAPVRGAIANKATVVDAAAGEVPAVPAPARNKRLVAGAAAAAVIVLSIVLFAGNRFKADKALETVRTEAPAVPAAESGAPQVVGVPSDTKPDAEAKESAPAAGPALTAKTDAPSKPAAAKAKTTQPEGANAPPPVATEKSARKEPVTAKNEARKNEVAKVEVKAATGTLEFWINPWGDVYIDGKQVGTSPPLKVYKLPAGTHQVEIYNDNAGFPYKVAVEVKADEVLRINQTFRAR